MNQDIERRHRLAQAQAYLAAGDSIRTAAVKAGVSHGILSRHLRDRDAEPSQERRGRPAALEMTVEEVNRLRFWRLTKDNSLPLAVEALLRDPVCRPETAEKLEEMLRDASRKGQVPTFPPSLRRLAHITAEERAHFRSKKQVQDFELVVSRGLTFIDVDGTERPLLPNSLWESDDMSLNQPFQWTDPATGRVLVGRQTLCTIDVFSHFWLAGHPIGRDRDAYRVEDIAAHFRAIIETKGVPYCWRLERGSWESNYIHGITLPDGRKWGGVDELFHVIHAFTSQGKGTIEGGFRYVQARMSHTSMDIGRVRGEYDFAARELRRAQQGQRDALERFWPIGLAADGLARAMAEDNAVLKKRRAHATPGNLLVRADDLYRAAVVRPLVSADSWRLCPTKKLTTVRNGKVMVTDKYYPQPFEFVVNNGSFPGYVPDGTKVLIAFTPSAPWEGCWIFNSLARTDPHNRERRAFGALITIAPPLVESPQFSLAGTFSEQKKTANAAVRTEYREIVPKGEHPGLKTSSARDGLGNVLHLQAGESRKRHYEIKDDPAPMPTKPARKRRIDAGQLREEALKSLFPLK